MKRYLIERDVEGIHALSPEDCCGAAATSNAALAQLAPRIQWVESFVSENKTFCQYLATDEDVIHEHARISGFPVTCIIEISSKIDPTTDRS